MAPLVNEMATTIQLHATKKPLKVTRSNVQKKITVKKLARTTNKLF